MRALRRRAKRALVAAALVLIAVPVVVQWRRGRVAEYRGGGQVEGLVDRLARGVPEDHPRVAFEDVTEAAGLGGYRLFPGTRHDRLVEDMGAGVALADADGDGWTDAFLVGCAAPEDAAPSRLYRNLGGTFEDVTAPSGIDAAGLGMGAAWVDVDGDADLDLATTRVGGVTLWRSGLADGAGLVFEDATAAAGLAGVAGFRAGLAVGDHGLDGDLDLYVTGYVVYDAAAEASGHASQYGRVISAMINPSSFPPEANLLLVNDGAGRFVDRAAVLGVDDPGGRGLGAVFTDLNQDGVPDLYVANDVSDNALFLGTREGPFVDATAQALVGDYRGAMGLVAGDFDGDRDLDLYVTHWVAQENALYTPYRLDDFAGKLPAGVSSAPKVPLYLDASEPMGLGHQALEKVGWAAHLFDYDDDGRRDLFVVNGSTIPLAEDPQHLEPMRSQLFWKHPTRRGYFEVGAVSGAFFRAQHVGRGGAGFDFDRDGDEDLLVTLFGEGAALLANGGGPGAALTLRLRQGPEQGNRFAVGARVLVEAELLEGAPDDAPRSWLAVLGTQGAYLSQHAVGEVRVGLGPARVVARVEVTWPDGTVEEAGPFAPRALVDWTRGALAREGSLPGRLARDAALPDAAAQKAFFARRKQAIDRRLAGDHAGAVVAYREALALWPGHRDASYYLGNSLAALGREVEALGAWQRLVDHEPVSSAGWMQLGLLRLPGGDARLDDPALARAAFERCHGLNPEEMRPLLMLGIADLLEGDLASAAERLADAAAHNPRSVEARWFGGRVAWERGDPEAAAALLGEAWDLATRAAADASASSEGDTTTGQAMTEAETLPLRADLTRWRTLADRAPDPAVEYGAAQ